MLAGQPAERGAELGCVQGRAGGGDGIKQNHSRPGPPRRQTPAHLTPLSRRPFPSEETAENDDDVYRSLEELAE